MMRPIWAAVIGAVVTACAAAPSTPLVTGSGPARGPGKVEPLKTGPLAYFQQACAHCHGPYGDSYTDHFYTITDFDKLKADVKRMADGPGMAPIEGNDLTAQVDYHKALIAKGPFLAWCGHDGDAISGEVTKGAKVSASDGEKPLTVEVKKTRWTISLPASASLAGVTITATLDAKQTALRLGEAAWSTKVTETAH
jgi:hypothetical protein